MEELLADAVADLGDALGGAANDVGRELRSGRASLFDAVDREGGNAREALQEAAEGGFSCFEPSSEFVDGRTTLPDIPAMPDMPEMPDLGEVKVDESMVERPSAKEKLMQATENAQIPLWSDHLPQNVVEALEQADTKWDAGDSHKFKANLSAQDAKLAQQIDPAGYMRINQHMLTGKDGSLPAGVTALSSKTMPKTGVVVQAYEYAPNGPNAPIITIAAIRTTDVFDGRHLSTAGTALAQGGRPDPQYEKDVIDAIEFLDKRHGPILVQTGHSQGALGADVAAQYLKRVKGRKTMVLGYEGWVNKKRAYAIHYGLRGNDLPGFYRDHRIAPPQKYLKAGKLKVPIPNVKREAGRLLEPLLEPVIDPVTEAIGDVLSAAADELGLDGFGLTADVPQLDVPNPQAELVDGAQSLLQELDLAGPLEGFAQLGVQQENEQEIEAEQVVENEG